MQLAKQVTTCSIRMCIVVMLRPLGRRLLSGRYGRARSRERDRAHLVSNAFFSPGSTVIPVIDTAPHDSVSYHTVL